MRKVLFSALAAVIVLAAASIWEEPIAAAEHESSEAHIPKGSKEEDGHIHHKGQHMKRADFEAYQLKKLKEIAVYFGISTEGKSTEQLKKEVAAAKEANKEKWEAFKEEYKAKRLKHLQKVAQEHGIKTKGKSADQLRKELHKLHGHHGKQPHMMKKDGTKGLKRNVTESKQETETE